MSVRFLEGDCLEVMKTLPDKSIDLFLCDLPYGCFEPSRRRSPDYVKKVKGSLVGQGICSWDIPIDLSQFWEQVKRLAKNDHTPVIHFCNARFGFELYNSNPDWFRYDLVWNKMRGVSFLLANKMPMSSHEHIYVFAKKGATYYRKDLQGDYPPSLVSKKNLERNTLHAGRLPKILNDNTGRRCVTSVLEFSNLTNTRMGGHHPTTKPLDLYTFLIERYSKEGDTILDPTFGSGNSGRVAIQLNRNYIGIEKNPTFYQKAIQSVGDNPQ